MTADPNDGPTPSAAAPAERFPTWKQVFILAGSSIVLGVTACFGFVEAVNSAWSIVLGLGFAAAVLMFLTSFVLFIWRAARGPVERTHD